MNISPMSSGIVPADSNLAWLLTRLKPGLKLYGLVVMLVTAVSILSLVDPLIVKWLVDVVLPARRTDLLLWSMLAILAVHIVRLTLHTLGSATTEYASRALASQIRLKLVRRTLSLSAAFLGATSIGELLQRLDKDVEQICEVGGGVASAMLRMVLSLVSVVGVMLYLNWRLTCILLPSLPIFLLLRQRYRDRLQTASEAVRERIGVQNGFLHEILSGVLQIQLLGCQRAIVRRFGLSLRECVRSDIDRQKHEFVFALTSAFIIAIGIAVIFGFGGWEVLRGTLSIGGLIAFYTYFTRLFDPLANAVETTTKLQRIRANIQQIRELERKEHALDGTPAPLESPIGGGYAPGCIRFEEVNFAYPDRSTALRGITLTLERGEMVAIVGANGCGKSTIFRLLSRMYDADSGRILIDNHDIRNVPIRKLRTMLAVVQQPILFSMSLRDNILLGNPGATEQDLRMVLRMSALETVIERLPSGIDERVGLGGFGLSGGECQRVAIARALMENKPILLLDEATSALDPESERMLIGSLKTELRDRLIVAVTHRPQAAQVADRVVVIIDGEIRDVAPHEVLWQKSPSYRRLWRELDTEQHQASMDMMQAPVVGCTTA